MLPFIEMRRLGGGEYARSRTAAYGDASNRAFMAPRSASTRVDTSRLGFSRVVFVTPEYLSLCGRIESVLLQSHVDLRESVENCVLSVQAQVT